MEQIGAVLRRLRQGAGLTAQQLAQQVGHSRSYVAGVETGAISPSQDFLAACEQFFSLPSLSLSGDATSRSVATMQSVDTVLTAARNLEAPAGAAERAPTSQSTYRPTPAEVLSTREEVEQKLVAMLAWPHHEDAEDDTITLVSLWGGRGAFGRALPEWLAAGLVSALDDGWNVEHLLRLDLTTQTVHDDIRVMLNLLTCKGRYEPLSTYAECAFDVLAVPGVGAVLFAADRGYFHSDIRDSREDLLVSHAHTIRKKASRLFTRYRHGDPAENIARYTRISSIERMAGDYCRVSSRPSTYTRPLAYWEADQRRRRRYPGWIDDKQKALETFEWDQMKHSYREICSRISLESFWREGYFAGVKRDVPPASHQERVLAFERILALLEHPRSNYEMRFTAGGSIAAGTSTTWWFKDTDSGPVVFLSATGPSGGMHVEVTDPDLAEHFRRQFELTWATLGGTETASSAVARWLRERLAELSTEGPPPRQV